MTTLKAKVGGIWVPLGGEQDEVFVGPDDPGAAYELWFDTDDPGLGDMSKLPRGFVAKVDSTHSGVLPANTDTNMMAGTNVTFEAGRRYRISTYWGANRGAATSQASVSVMGGATTLMGHWVTIPASWHGHSMVGYFLGDGTTKSVFVKINPGATTMDHSGCYVLVEDIGGV